MNTLPGLAKITAALMTGALAGMVCCSASADPVTPFVGSSAGIWQAGGAVLVVPEVIQSNSVGPVVTHASDQPRADAIFRAAFGSNGFAIQVQSLMNREAYGASFWSDGFVVTGGAGTGLLSLSTSVSGSVSGLGEMNYALFVSSQPFDLGGLISAANQNHLGFWALTLPNATRVMYTGVSNGCGAHNWSRECGHVPFENFQGTLDLTLTASVPYTSGQPLYVISVFAGGVGNDGGVESFMNSADFGISAPIGASVQSLSTTAYAAAVPEPATWFLLASGLFLGLLRRRTA